MEFVFSSWIIVALVLIVCIITCLVVFFKMNKTDVKLTDEFVKKQYEEMKQKEQNATSKNKEEMAQ